MLAIDPDSRAGSSQNVENSNMVLLRQLSSECEHYQKHPRDWPHALGAAGAE